MKRFLFLALLATSQVFAASVITSSGGGYELNRAGALNRKYSVGTHLSNGPFGVKGKWKFSDQGGGSGLVNLHDAEGLNIVLPSKAVIRDCMIDVVTQPTSATGASSIGFNSKAAGDLKAVTVISALTTGLYACTPAGTAVTSVKIASETTIKLNVVSEALTAGEINVWLEYALSE